MTKAAEGPAPLGAQFGTACERAMSRLGASIASAPRRDPAGRLNILSPAGCTRKWSLDRLGNDQAVFDINARVEVGNRVVPKVFSAPGAISDSLPALR